jgi:heme exporter protein A
MADRVVEGRNLVREFGSVRALCGLDLEVRRGESLAIFGPNGAGKTTLIRILAALLAPTRGELRLFGNSRATPEVRRRIGLVSHGSSLYGDLTAIENLRFYAELYGLDRREDRIREVLSEVGLLEWAERPVRGYSRGMEQRLALARAFLHDPELLLLDEPYSGLDPRAVARLQEILLRLHRAGKTLVLTTHDIARGLEICDRAAILSSGRIAWHSGRFVPGAQEMTRIYERATGGPG